MVLPWLVMNRKEIKIPEHCAQPGWRGWEGPQPSSLGKSLGQGKSKSESGSCVKGPDVNSTQSLALKLYHYRKLD